jgi:hypothetical protein
MINFISFIIGFIFGMAALLLYAYIIDKIDDRKFKKNTNNIINKITNKNILNLNYD